MQKVHILQFSDSQMAGSQFLKNTFLLIFFVFLEVDLAKSRRIWDSFYEFHVYKWMELHPFINGDNERAVRRSAKINLNQTYYLK
jgi:hypothetical protein